MALTFLRFLLTSFLLFVLAGCARKPAPEPVPSPMTVAYLLRHMQVKHHPALGQMTVGVLPVVSWRLFHDTNATLQSVVSAQFHDTEPAAHPLPEQTEYLLIFSLSAGQWGDFDSALDTLGNRLNVMPYTSGIRNGVYYDNFYIPVTLSWLRQAAHQDVELLLMNESHELSCTIPHVYPEALLQYLDVHFPPDGNRTQ